MSLPVFCYHCKKIIKDHNSKDLVRCSLGIIKEVGKT